ncbi:MAG: hypothetical protein AB7L91_18440 [Dehalococcoidia bacterium]
MREVKTRRKAADLALAALADEVQALLGQPMSLLMRADEDGTALLQVGPVGAGDVEPPKFDDEVLLALVDAHVPPAPEPDEVDDLDAALSALESATTVAQVKAALLALFGKDRARRASGRVTRLEVGRG